MINYIIKKTYNLFFYVLLMNFIQIACEFLPNLKISNKIRGILLKPFFKKVGKNFQLAKGVTINMSRNIEIKDNVYFAHNVWINGTGGLFVDSGVIISPNSVIATTKHVYSNGEISNTESENKEIIIGKGSWICSNSTVTMGVIIGKGCIIAAGSTVTKSVEDYSLVGGVPAKLVKKLN